MNADRPFLTPLIRETRQEGDTAWERHTFPGDARDMNVGIHRKGWTYGLTPIEGDPDGMTHALLVVDMTQTERQAVRRFVTLYSDDPVTRAGEIAMDAVPRGELWQNCFVRGCRAEPVNLCCERCDRHCTCVEDARQRAELEATAPGLQAKIAEYDDQARRGIE